MFAEQSRSERFTRPMNCFMKWMAVILFAAIFFVTVSAQDSFAGNVNVTVKVKYGQSEARQILNMINRFRTSSDAWYWNENNTSRVTCRGLSTLQYDTGLEKVAMQRAAEIAVAYGHTRPNGQTCFTAFAESGVSYISAGENIAAGYDTAAEVHEAWREDYERYIDQGHRRVMLSEKYNAVGIGHVYYNGYHYWVEEFGKISNPRNTAKAVNAEKSVNVSVQDTKIRGLKVSFASNLQYMKVGAQANISSVKLNIDGQWPENMDRPVNMMPTLKVSSSSTAYIDSGKLIGKSEGSATVNATLLGKSCSMSVKVHNCSQHGSIGASCGICGSIVTAQIETPQPREVQQVNDDQETSIPSKSEATIKLSKTKLTLKKGKAKVIKVSKLKDGDSVESWKTSNKKVATVDKDGKIKAVGKGKAVIKVTLMSGKEATVKVIVK